MLYTLNIPNFLLKNKINNKIKCKILKIINATAIESRFDLAMSTTQVPNFITQCRSSSSPPLHHTVSWKTPPTEQYDLIINMYFHFKVLTSWLYVTWKAKALDVLISYLILFLINVRFLWDFTNRSNLCVSSKPLEVWEHGDTASGPEQTRQPTQVSATGGTGRSTGVLITSSGQEMRGFRCRKCDSLPFSKPFQWAQTTGTKNVCSLF